MPKMGTAANRIVQNRVPITKNTLIIEKLFDVFKEVDIYSAAKLIEN